MMNNITFKKRHFFACYSLHGEAYIQNKMLGDVIAFTCPIARDNWIELTNKYSSNCGKGSVAIKASSTFARKVLSWEKGQTLLFQPIEPDSIFFISELSGKSLYLTTVDRNS